MKTSPSTAFPLPAVLGVVFITLKLCGVISWSWWWVLSPFWICGLIAITVVVLAFMVELHKAPKGTPWF